MPQRGCSQRVEEKSRRAFADALGEPYLFRDEVPDISIDGGVEAFGPDDQPTGLRYLVQLKATDGELNSRTLAVRISLDKATYYGSLSLPVLMVRYFRKTGTLYARWFHGIASRPHGGGKPRKTIMVRWRPEDEMDASTPDRLAAEARSFLDLRSSRPPFPFPFALRASEPILGIAPTQLAIALRQELQRRGDIVDFRRDVPAGSGAFVVNGLGLAVELPGATLASYDLSDSYEPGPNGEQLAVDLLVLAAIAFVRWGQADAAGRLTRDYYSRSTLVGQIEAAVQLSSEMARARQVREALAVAEELDQLDDPDAHEAGFVFTLPALHNSKSLTEDEIALHRKTLRRRIERREARGDLIAAAREYVNLANEHRFHNEPSEAVALYQRAAECDPEYRDRAHYWTELAGVLFLSGRFDDAVQGYARALGLGANAFIQLLHADSLLFAGRYREARETFAGALKTEHSFERSAEYVLKQYLLDDLIERLGLETQKRNPTAAATLIEIIEDAPDPEAASGLMVRALRQDGLCGNAWFNLAHSYRDRGEEGIAGSLFISAAVCNGEDDEAWALATVLTWNAGDMMLVPLIFMTGERLTAGRLLPRVAEIAAEHLEPEKLDMFLTAFEVMLADLSDAPGDSYAVRRVNPGEPVAITELPGATAPR